MTSMWGHVWHHHAGKKCTLWSRYDIVHAPWVQLDAILASEFVSFFLLAIYFLMFFCYLVTLCIALFCFVVLPCVLHLHRCGIIMCHNKPPYIKPGLQCCCNLHRNTVNWTPRKKYVKFISKCIYCFQKITWKYLRNGWHIFPRRDELSSPMLS